MTQIERDDIHLISRHSNLSEKSIASLLNQQVYNNSDAWKKFLKLFFIALGVGFTVAGIVFFFAYNWADLHKFSKIGLVEGLLIIATLTAVFSNLSEEIKNIILTGASVLVGVLFAVFGQIYQTGANAYDFFLGWTIFIAIWAIIANYSVLWLVFIALLNTTLVLYIDQVAHHWPDIYIPVLLVVINGLFLTYFIMRNKDNQNRMPNWFIYVLATVVVTFSTIGINMGMFGSDIFGYVVMVLLTLILYAAGIWYGLSQRKVFYLAIIAFSIIMIISSLVIRISADFNMFFLLTIFVVGSVTMVIKYLNELQKKWKNG